MTANDSNNGLGTRGKRALILTVLLVAVTFFWVLMLLYTNLPVWAMAGIGLVSLLLLSLATAWTAMAFPSRSKQ